ncbi:MAG: Xaa-Pro peptidase family protein [Nitrososphaerota archaeon]
MRYAERLEKLATLMRVHGIENFLITRGPNLLYFAGIDGPAALVVSLKLERPVLFVPPLSLHAAEEYAYSGLEINNTGTNARFEVVVAETLSSLDGTLAVDDIDIDTYRLYSALLREREIRQGSSVIWELREVKDEEEIQAIRKACEVADRAMRAAYEVLYPGITENEVKAEVLAEIHRSGGERPAFDVIVASGPRSALPHGPLQRGGMRDRALARGDVVLIDLGAVVEGYHSDITRTFALGKVGEEFETAYRYVLAAKEAAEQYIKPDTHCSYPDSVARRKLEEARLDQHFMHSLGHGVGLEIHEQPRMSPTSSEVLAANMVVTCEPGVYIKGKWGVRLEDTVLVTERGAERLTTFSLHDYEIDV